MGGYLLDIYIYPDFIFIFGCVPLGGGIQAMTYYFLDEAIFRRLLKFKVVHQSNNRIPGRTPLVSFMEPNFKFRSLDSCKFSFHCVILSMVYLFFSLLSTP